MGFLSADPLLFDPKSLAQEKELVMQIHRAIRLGEQDDLTPEEPVLSPNQQDFKEVMEEEREAFLQ